MLLGVSIQFVFWQSDADNWVRLRHVSLADISPIIFALEARAQTQAQTQPQTQSQTHQCLSAVSGSLFTLRSFSLRIISPFIVCETLKRFSANVAHVMRSSFFGFLLTFLLY